MKKLLLFAALFSFMTGTMLAQAPAAAPAQPKKEMAKVKSDVPAATQTAVKVTPAAPMKKDGTPDKRFKANKKLKKDGTPDMRYKEHKAKTAPVKETK